MERVFFISVAQDFTATPGGRYRTDGEFSGEQFREEVLVPRFNQAVEGSSELVVDLDGVAGYATSFLEEAFGGLVRTTARPGIVSKYLKIQTANDLRQREVESYISDAETALPNA